MKRAGPDNAHPRLHAFLREIYSLQGVDSFYAKVLSGLGHLVTGHNVFIGEHDMRNTLVTGCVVRHLFETKDFITIVNSCAGDHPLWEPIRTGNQIVRCISEYASMEAWQNTQLYKEALGLEGVRDHISIEFGNRRDRIVSIGVFRDRRGFSDREKDTMSLLIPHLELAMANARLADSIGLGTQAAQMMEHDSMIALDAAGGPGMLPRQVYLELLQFFPSHEFGGQRLPPELRNWITISRDLLDRGALDHSPPPYRRRKGNLCLGARLFRRRFEPGYLLLLHTRRLEETPLLRFTKRERDVLHWVAEGKTNDEIALILQTKSSTIKSHLKSLFRKLGVENRTAAARFARSLQYSAQVDPGHPTKSPLSS